MNVSATLSRALTEPEKEALRHYGADSSYLHVIAQGRSADLERDAEFAKFLPSCRSIAEALDSAIAVSSLDHDSQLYSAHGNGLGVRGSLGGDPSDFVGLVYGYPGYISTTTEADFRDRFLSKRRNANSKPTILDLRLPAGFAAIDMHHGNHAGEFEFLLGRNLAFRITEASIIDGDVLVLVMEP